MDFIRRYKTWILIIIILCVTGASVYVAVYKGKHTGVNAPVVQVDPIRGPFPSDTDSVPAPKCPEDTKVCMDGNVVGRFGADCKFLDCPLDPTLKTKLADCLPKSDPVSKEFCAALLKYITTYRECVFAGFDIQKSNPEQCATPDGRVFVNK